MAYDAAKISAAQDVVIGSGGAMLKRFVQALHFAKRCKDMGSEPKN